MSMNAMHALLGKTHMMMVNEVGIKGPDDHFIDLAAWIRRLCQDLAPKVARTLLEASLQASRVFHISRDHKVAFQVSLKFA